VLKTSGQRQSINVISAVNARGEFWAATYCQVTRIGYILLD